MRMRLVSISGVVVCCIVLLMVCVWMISQELKKNYPRTLTITLPCCFVFGKI